MNKILIAVAGPTASGKTSLAISLANHFQSEIISADSRQFYKEMPIGTAQPSSYELQQVKHHFIASHSIHEELNIGSYEQEANKLLGTLFKKKSILFLVGGSGLYINAVCNGLDDLPTADKSLRNLLEKELQENGIDFIGNRLKDLDPEYYELVDIQNPQRVLRALEVCILSGKKYSDLRKGTKKQREYQVIKIGLTMDRSALYERINQRVDQMMEMGLLEEARQLIPYKHLNPLQTVGYSELFDFFDGKQSLEKAIELIKQHTRNFAKRQLTWFRRDEEIQWFKPDEEKQIIGYLENKIASATSKK